MRGVTSASTRDPFFLARRPSASCLTCARRAQGAARAACRGLPIRPASAAAGAVRLSASSARRPPRPSRPPPSRPHLRRPSSSLLLVAAARPHAGCPPVHPGRLPVLLCLQTARTSICSSAFAWIFICCCAATHFLLHERYLSSILDSLCVLLLSVCVCSCVALFCSAHI